MSRLAHTEKPAQEARPVYFRGHPHRQEKRFFLGGYRSRSPEETLAIIKPAFNRINLTRLANITGLDRLGIPTVQSVRPNSGNLSVDGGKGITIEAAMASAAMECIERYHVENLRLPEFALPSYKVHEKYPTIPISHLPLARNSLFSPRLPQRWVLGWDILNQLEVAVPRSLLLLTGANAGPGELGHFQFSTNGLASGNNFLEALLSGVLELIERDAIACHTYAEKSAGWSIPKVIPETISFPLVCDLLERFNKAAVRPMLFDCTVDTNVPVYMAYIYDELARNVGVFRGYGAHLDPEIAMVRALTEAAQSRLIYIAGARDDFFKENLLSLQIADSRRFVQKLEALPAIVEAPAGPLPVYQSFEADIYGCMDRLRPAGVEQIIVLDLTQPGFDICVVKVIIPPLEGYPFRDFYQQGPRARMFAARVAQNQGR
jgi:YcaO-like protein with predicted kinase domain